MSNDFPPPEGSLDELKNRYPYTADYLETVFVEQGGIHDSYLSAFKYFCDSSSESAQDLEANLRVERENFYREFTTEVDRITAFYNLGGVARNAQAMQLYLPECV